MPEVPAPPAAAPRDPALDGLRGLAILLVFLFHYGGGLRAHQPLIRLLGYLTQAGWVGVDLFFVLSGFLITGSLLDTLGRSHSLPRFYARRALRILPLYLTALLLCAAAALLWGAAFFQLRPLLIYLGFLQNLPPLVASALHTPPPLPLFHLWSLAVEEQFYLLWPFLLLLAARSPRKTLLLCLATFALSCGFRAVVFAPGVLSDEAVGRFTTVLPVRLGGLALGGALAACLRLLPARLKMPPARTARWVLVAAAAGFLLQGWRSGSLLLAGRLSFQLGLPLADLGCAAAVALALEPGRWRRLLGVPALAWVGRISYGFYVFHLLLEPLYDWLGSLLTHATAGFLFQGVRLLVAFGLTLVVSAASFRWLELPFLRQKRWFR